MAFVSLNDFVFVRNFLFGILIISPHLSPYKNPKKGHKDYVLK